MTKRRDTFLDYLLAVAWGLALSYFVVYPILDRFGRRTPPPAAGLPASPPTRAASFPAGARPSERAPVRFATAAASPTGALTVPPEPPPVSDSVEPRQGSTPQRPAPGMEQRTGMVHGGPGEREVSNERQRYAVAVTDRQAEARETDSRLRGSHKESERERPDQPRGYPGAASHAESILQLLAAIRQVESSGNDRAEGDYRKGVPLARGAYQIHRVWWIDSGGDPETYLRDVWDANVCLVRIMALWRKRCPAALAAGDLETLARTFRRPTKPNHPDNAAYVAKVKGELW